MILRLSRLATSLDKAAQHGLMVLVPPIGGAVDEHPHGTEGRLTQPAVPGAAPPKTKKIEGPRAYGPRIQSVT